MLLLLTSATKLRQGDDFTPVCDSVHRGVSVHGVFARETSVWLRAGGTHPTGMHSCCIVRINQ